MNRPALSEIYDLDRYPLADPPETLLADTRAALDREGCAVLRGFARPEGLPRLVAEAEAAAPRAHRSFGRTNAYFTRDDPSLPPSHPRRRFHDRSNAFIAADNFGPESVLRRLYEWPPFAAFIRAALGEERFHPYADPLADVIVNMAEEGAGFPWHFDTNNYTVTLALQNAEHGGAFEYAPWIRTPTDERIDQVAAVLDGRSDRVRTLLLQPGDLQIFKGRYALHRVTPLSGPRRRFVAIFSFVEEPGMVATPERARQLYGRALPIHFERAGLRADNLLD